jgi:hypothetical protein
MGRLRGPEDRPRFSGKGLPASACWKLRRSWQRSIGNRQSEIVD